MYGTSTNSNKKNKGFLNSILYDLYILISFYNFNYIEVTLTRHNKKRIDILFVLLSFFRNFGFAEVTCTWHKKRKKISFCSALVFP